MILTRARIIARDGEHCPHCGTTEGLTIQHRANRGMGGRPSADVPSNGIMLCGLLNQALELDASLAAWAVSCGWKLGKNEPTDERPYWDATLYRWVRIRDDWSRELL